MKHVRTQFYGCMLLFALAFFPAKAIFAAQTNPPPLPVVGPRASPPAVPAQRVIQGEHLYNDLVFPNLPVAAQQADLADAGKHQDQPGRGVKQTANGLGAGLTAQSAFHVCNDFNQRERWASHGHAPTDIWSDHYAGWGAFAQNDGNFYAAANVVFSLEQSVGPGRKFGQHQYAAKIAGGQPYAAGFGSPLIAVPPGAAIVVRVRYLIFDHDTAGQDFDWVSLGIKPDATGPQASYANGYVRGQWAELSHQITAGKSGKIMVLLQAQSPAALNSNIYFDDVAIAINGRYLSNCLDE